MLFFPLGGEIKCLLLGHMKEEYSINDAIKNLSILADFSVDHPQCTGLVDERKQFITDKEEISRDKVLWFAEENIDPIKESILETYQVVLDYLEKICKDEGYDWKSPKVREGIQEIMHLVGKSKDVVDLYIDEISQTLPTEKLGKSEIYQKLGKYYQEHVQKKFVIPLEGKEDWEENWKGEQALSLDLDKSALKAFDSLKSDLEYELFYLKNAEGAPFFSKVLLRNIQLYCNFDEEKDTKLDDPLLKIAVFKDKNYQSIADQMIKSLYHLIEEFYVQKKEGKEKKLFFSVNKIVMSLFLAANPKNLLSKTKSKAATKYFMDMLEHLHNFLSSKDYNRLARKEIIFIDLVNAICFQLFLNKGGIKEELIGYIHLLMRKGLERSEKAYIEKEDTSFNCLLKGDDQIRSLLAHFPNGPLFKILDSVHDRIEEFYPIMQENLPKRLYPIKFLENKTTILKIPSPTRQTTIAEASPAPEFLAFLRAIKKRGQTLLFCNLQDRTSWKEHARTQLIEELGDEKEFKKNLFVATLAKDTDFYYQIGSYQHLDKAEDFVALFKEHLLSGEDYGYFFCKQLDTKKMQSFIPKAIDTIWELFYEKRSVLTRKNRMDFIEIFYHLLLMKIMEIAKPDFLSLSCKDALDLGSVFSASFFGFLSLIQGKKIDEDFMRYLIYSEALLVRERAVNSQRLSRELSALAYFDQYLEMDRNKKLKILSSLFKTSFLSSIDISD